MVSPELWPLFAAALRVTKLNHARMCSKIHFRKHSIDSPYKHKGLYHRFRSAKRQGTADAKSAIPEASTKFSPSQNIPKYLPESMFNYI